MGPYFELPDLEKSRELGRNTENCSRRDTWKEIHRVLGRPGKYAGGEGWKGNEYRMSSVSVLVRSPRYGEVATAKWERRSGFGGDTRSTTRGPGVE